MKIKSPIMQRINPVIFKTVLIKNINKIPQINKRTDSSGISFNATNEYSKLEIYPEPDIIFEIDSNIVLPRKIFTKLVSSGVIVKRKNKTPTGIIMNVKRGIAKMFTNGFTSEIVPKWYKTTGAVTSVIAKDDFTIPTQ